MSDSQGCPSGQAVQEGVPVAEHPPGGPVAAHTGEDGGAVQPGQPRRLPGVHECRASPEPRGTHHPAGTAGKRHQNHQRAADGHVCQPAQSPRPLHPGTLTTPLSLLRSRCAQPVPSNRVGSASPLTPSLGSHGLSIFGGVTADTDAAPGASPPPSTSSWGGPEPPCVRTCFRGDQSCPRVPNQGGC